MRTRASFFCIVIATSFLSSGKCRFLPADINSMTHPEYQCLTPLFQNANITLRGGSSAPMLVPPGTQIQIQCLPGYSFGRHLHPVIIRICTNDGEWSTINDDELTPGDFAQCRFVPEDLINQYFSSSTKSSTTVEMTTTVTTPKTTMPEDLRITCPAVLVENGAVLAYTGYKRILEITDNFIELLPGNRIRVICDPGYVLSHGEEFSFCSTDGQWSNELGKCISLKLEHRFNPFSSSKEFISSFEVISAGETSTMSPTTETLEETTTVPVTVTTELDTTTTPEITTTTSTTTKARSESPTPFTTMATQTTTQSPPVVSTTTESPPPVTTMVPSTSTTTKPIPVPILTSMFLTTEERSTESVLFSTTSRPTTVATVASTTTQETMRTSFLELNVSAVTPNDGDRSQSSTSGEQVVEDGVVELTSSEIIALRQGLFKNCGPVPLLFNGVISDDGSSLSGAFRKVTCNFGYTLVGSENVSCTDEGLWLVSSLCAPACMTSPDVENAVFDKLSSKNDIGTQRKFRCNKGFTLHGSNVVRCDETGKWFITGSCDRDIEKMTPLKRHVEVTIAYMDEGLGDLIPQIALNVTSMAFRYRVTVFDQVKYISERFNEIYGNYWATVIGSISTAISGKYVTPYYIMLRRGDVDIIIYKESCTRSKPHLTTFPTSRPLDTSKFYFLPNSHGQLSNATRQDALNFVSLAFKLFKAYDEIANFVQNQFNLAFDGDWLCIVGPSSFDVYYWYEQPLFISIGKIDDSVSINIIHPPVCAS